MMQWKTWPTRLGEHELQRQALTEGALSQAVEQRGGSIHKGCHSAHNWAPSDGWGEGGDVARGKGSGVGAGGGQKWKAELSRTHPSRNAMFFGQKLPGKTPEIVTNMTSWNL